MQVELTEEKAPDGFERLVAVREADSGLQAFIAIHSTRLGPAVGGCRMWPYPDQDAARRDVLLLAAGMTAKNALAGIAFGGGKSVILGDPKRDKTPALLRAFGCAVENLEGLYYTAEDVGMTPGDLALMAEETRYAVGLPSGSGDPSPFTAEGVFACLKVGAASVFRSADLTGRRVLIQGLGAVGGALAGKLHAAGAELIVSDINAAALQQARAAYNAEICPPDLIFEAKMDIFAPCALGGILTADTANRLSARLVCGAANNQLAGDSVAHLLRARGIRYLPDYVVNAGGVINVASEITGGGAAYREARLAGITERIADILKRSAATGQSSLDVAEAMVADILAEARAA